MSVNPDTKIQHLAGTLTRVRWRSSDRFVACCPAHPDRNPSLSISLGERGLLVKCWAGCTVEEIVQAMGLRTADLFYDGNSDQQQPRRRPRRPIHKPWRYDWRRTSRDILNHADTLFLRAESVLAAARGLIIDSWTDAELDAALGAVSQACQDRERADLLTDVVFNLRCRGLAEEAKRRAHAA